VHTITLEVHILSLNVIPVHINLDQLVELKIPAFSGVKAKNNKLILETIAMNGPLIKYDVFRNLKLKGLDRYSTVSRRMDDLKERRYLAEAGKRVIKRGRQEEESKYGLTWRGFVACLSIEQVRSNIIQVLKNNPLLRIPEKETILSILNEISTQQELKVLIESILNEYFVVIPNIELINDEHLWMWLLTIRQPQLPKDFKFSKIPEDGWELLDRPVILRLIKEKIIPSIRQNMIATKIAYVLFKTLDNLGNFISNLNEKDKPSKKIRAYIENDLEKSFRALEKDL